MGEASLRGLFGSLRRAVGARPARAAAACALVVATALATLPLSAHAADEVAARPVDGLTIGVMSDPHYFPAEYQGTRAEDYQSQISGDLRLMGENEALTEAAVDQMIADDESGEHPLPSVLLVTGDLSSEGEQTSHEGFAEQMTRLQEAGVTVLVIPGNHDLYNDSAMTFQDDTQVRDNGTGELYTTEAEFRDIYASMGYDEEATKAAVDDNPIESIEYYRPVEDGQIADCQGGLSYVARLEGGVALVMIDTEVYTTDFNGNSVAAGSGGGMMSDALRDWVKSEAAELTSEGYTIVAGVHHPVLDHQTTAETEFVTDRVDVQSGEGGTAKDNANVIATELADAGIHYVFSGHMHENDVASYTTAAGNVIYDMETGGLCAYPSPYRYATITTTEAGETTLELSSVSVKQAKMNQRLAEAGGTELAQTEPVDVREYEKDAMYGDKDAETGESFITRLVMRYAARYVDQLVDIPAALQNIAGIDLYDLLLGDLLPSLLGGGTTIDLGGSIGTIEVSYSSDPADPDASGIHLNPESGAAGLLGSYTVRDADIRTEVQSVLDQIEENYVANGRLERELSALLEGVGDVNLLNPENPDDTTGDCYTLRELLQDMFQRHNSGEDTAAMPDEMQRALTNLATSELLQNKVEDVLANTLFPLVDEVLGSTHVNLDTLFGRNVLWSTAINAVAGGSNPSISELLDTFGLDLTGEGGVLRGLIDQYLTSSVYQQIGGLVDAMVSGFASDGDGLDDVVDGDAVTLEASMSPEPHPTVENGALPDQVSMSLDGDDTAASRQFSWYTATYVEGSDVQIVSAEGISDAEAAAEAMDAGTGVTQETSSDVRVANKAKVTLNLVLITNYEVVQENHHTATAAVPAGDFYYRVGSEQDGYWSDPVLVDGDADAGDGYTAIVVADSQGSSEADYEDYEQVLAEAEASTSDEAFALHLGDMVDDGTNENYWSWLMDTDASMGVATMPVAGNHEARQDDEALANAVAAHYNVDIPEQDTSTGIYYSFVYGDATYIVLNTNDGDSAVGDAQRQWASETAAAAETTWKIVVTHKAPYSKGSHQGDSDVVALRGWLDSFCAQNDVDLVLSGHDHTYMRTPSLSGGAEAAVTTKTVSDGAGNSYEAQVNPAGTTFVIPSTSGTKYYDIVENDLPTAFSWQGYQPVWSTLEIDGDTLFWRSYAYDAETDASTCIDSFAITKDDNLTPAEEVMQMIDALPDPDAGSEPILAAEKDVEASRAAYDELEDADKEQVSNLSKLEQLEQLIEVYQDIAGKETVDLSTGIYYDGKDDDEGQRRAAFKEAIADPDVGTIILPGDYSTAIGEYSGNTLNDQYYTVDHNVVIRAADGSQGFADLRRCGFIVTDGATLVLDDVKLQAWQKKPFIGSTTPMNMIRVEDGTLVANGNTSVLVNRDDGSTDGFKDESWRGHAIIVGNPDKGSATGERAVYLNLSDSGTISGLRDSVAQHAESSSPSDSVHITGGVYNTIYSGNSSVNLSCDLEIDGGAFTKVTSYGDLTVTGGAFNGASVDYPIYMGGGANLYVKSIDVITPGTSGRAFHVADGGELHISSDALAKLDADLGLGISAGSATADGWPLTATATGLGDADAGTIYAVGQQITTMPGMAANQRGALETQVSGSTLTATAALAADQSAYAYARYHVAAGSALMGFVDGNTGDVYAYSGYTMLANPRATVSVTADPGTIVAWNEQEPPAVQLTAGIEPADATRAVTWSSSDEDVATVDKGGMVTFKQAGQVTVTATHATTGAVARVTLSAVEPSLSGSKTYSANAEGGQPYELSLDMGALSVTDLPEGYGVEWTLSEGAAATVEPDASDPLRATLTRTGSDASKVTLTATLTRNGEPTGISASMEVTIEQIVAAPTDADVQELLSVKVSDEGAADHGDATFALLANTEGTSDSFSVGAPYLQTEGTGVLSVVERSLAAARGTSVWRVDVTVHADRYVAAYDERPESAGRAHALAGDRDVTVTLAYNEAEGAWQLLDAGSSPVVFEVACEEVALTEISVTPDAGNTGHTYDGAGHGFSFTTDPAGVKGFTVEYRATDAADADPWSAEAQVDAGTYDVRVTRAADDTYAAFSRVFADGLVIAKAQYAVPDVHYAEGEAEGSVRVILQNGNADTYLWSKSDDLTDALEAEDNEFEVTRAGTYYVFAEGDANHEASPVREVRVIEVTFDDGDGISGVEAEGASFAEGERTSVLMAPGHALQSWGGLPAVSWDGHELVGWSAPNGSVVTDLTAIEESMTVTAQWNPPAPEPEPETPTPPTAEQVAQMEGIGVTLHDVNELNGADEGGEHADASFSAAAGAVPLIAGSLTVGAPVQGADDSWTVQVTIDGGAYLDAYADKYGEHYFADPADQEGARTFALAYDEATGAWGVAEDTAAHFSFDVTCLTLRPAEVEKYVGGESSTGGHFTDQYVVDGQGNAYTIGELNGLLAGQTARIAYFDEAGAEIADDTVPGTYEARIVLSGSRGDQAVVTVDGTEYAYALEPSELVIRSVSESGEAEDGALNVPLVDGSDPSAVAGALEAASGGVVAALPEGTRVFFNGNHDVELADTSGVELLSDDLLPGQREGELIAHAEETLGVQVGEAGAYDFQYLDLVDGSQSNAWVSSSEGTRVFWRIPEGADPSSISVYHFAGLHRDYDADDAEVSDLIAASTVETVAVEVDEANGYVSFTVPESGFSPFLMTWERASDPDGGGSGGDTGDSTGGDTGDNGGEQQGGADSETDAGKADQQGGRLAETGDATTVVGAGVPIVGAALVAGAVALWRRSRR
uniref:metallophosphoesterase n=1 Tax=Olsenella timonensis TaxID=1805478 RepID=UPI00094E2018|nr:metallophosphoesterase [Olsenella timonensis]